MRGRRFRGRSGRGRSVFSRGRRRGRGRSRGRSSLVNRIGFRM